MGGKSQKYVVHLNILDHHLRLLGTTTTTTTYLSNQNSSTHHPRVQTPIPTDSQALVQAERGLNIYVLAVETRNIPRVEK
jgi:hypothetical protein